VVDVVSPETRSRIMAQVKSKGTKPEMKVRRLLHGMGYRYRLHRADLPGRPDLVFPSKRKVVFVNGCFWHHHAGCGRASVPSANRDFWLRKFRDNKARDAKNAALLETAEWKTVTVWECQLEDLHAVSSRLVAFLENVAPQDG
jgi:DNA mismatch endonuclease (patch repair protein)